MDLGTNHYNTRGAPTGYMAGAQGHPFPWQARHLNKKIKLHFLAYYYHLTGYRRAKEVFDEVTDGIKQAARQVTELDDAGNRVWKPNHSSVGNGREIYNTNRFLVNGYLETLDPELKQYARLWIDKIMDEEFHPDLHTMRHPRLYISLGMIMQLQLWNDDRLRDLLLKYLKTEGYPDMPAGGVTNSQSVPLAVWAYEQTGDERYARITYDAARSIADTVADWDWTRPETPRYPYGGGEMCMHRLIPMLSALSVADREKGDRPNLCPALFGPFPANWACPLFRSDVPLCFRDTYVASPRELVVHLRPNKSGRLSIEFRVRGLEEGNMSARVVGPDGSEIQKFVVSPPTESVSNEFWLDDRSAVAELVFPHAVAAANYRIVVESNNRSVSVLCPNTQVMYEPPKGILRVDTVYGPIGPRFYTQTRADRIQVESSDPYAIRDSETWELLFRSRLNDPPALEHHLGLDRAIVFILCGTAHRLRIRGTSRYVGHAPDELFKPR